MHARTVVYTAPRVVELLDLEVKPLGPHDVLIEAECTLISAGTERTFLEHAPYYPFFPGYSMVGRVVKAGSDVSMLNVGDRVVANSHHAAVVVCHEHFALAIPDEVRSDLASFFQIGLMALYVARLAEIRLGDRVAVLGMGLIGLIAIQVARLAGAVPVVGLDINDSRMAHASRLGADVVQNATDSVGLDRLIAGTPGGGFDAVIELTGSPEPIDSAIRMVRQRGRVVAASFTTRQDFRPSEIYGQLWWKGATLKTGYLNSRPFFVSQKVVAPVPQVWPIQLTEGGEYLSHDATGNSYNDTRLFLDQLAHGRLQLESLITHRVPVVDAPKALTNLLAPGQTAIGTIIEWK